MRLSALMLARVTVSGAFVISASGCSLNSYNPSATLDALEQSPDNYGLVLIECESKFDNASGPCAGNFLVTDTPVPNVGTYAIGLAAVQDSVTRIDAVEAADSLRLWDLELKTQWKNYFLSTTLPPGIYQIAGIAARTRLQDNCREYVEFMFSLPDEVTSTLTIEVHPGEVQYVGRIVINIEAPSAMTPSPDNFSLSDEAVATDYTLTLEAEAWKEILDAGEEARKRRQEWIKMGIYPGDPDIVDEQRVYWETTIERRLRQIEELRD